MADKLPIVDEKKDYFKMNRKKMTEDVMRLKDKVAVVTGAGSGLGKKIAEKLAEEGAKVALADISLENAKKAKEEIEKNGGEAEVFQADVTSEEQIQKLFADVEKKFGGIDLLYNNAGISPVGTVETTTYQEFQKVLAIDLYSVFLGCKYVISYMRKRGGGSIVNTAGTFGIKPIPNKIGYCCAKAGVISITRSVAIDMAKDNIRCNAICPGFVDTPLNKDFVGEERENFLKTYQPMDIKVEAEDIANMAVFLSCEEARTITGQPMVIDGGTEACLYY